MQSGCRDNVAYLGGGAIDFQGVPLSSLLIESSVFVANVVRPIGGKGIDVTVMINTGGIGLGTAFNQNHQWTAPMWRVDDGPVFGISGQLCQGAKQLSLVDVSEGLPPPFPMHLPCANATYTGPDSTYSHVVNLEEGAHTLWVGVVPMSQERSRGWLGGSIEIASVVGPLFPNPPDK